MGPVQIGTQVLTDAQNAIAGWRRVIGILDTPADVVDPGESGTVLPREAVTISFDDVGFAYPGGAPVLHDIDLEIAPNTRVAVVGETESGWNSFPLAKLLTRLMDPTSGVVRLDGIDLRDVPFASLRERVVLVPQEGFLFDATLRANALYGKLDATDSEIQEAVEQLYGLTDWLETLPWGLDTRVGQRGGESLSAGSGEQWRSSAPTSPTPTCWSSTRPPAPTRPWRCGSHAPSNASSAAARKSVTIAHRMSTAENADEVVVVDKGRIKRGPHARLVAEGGICGAPPARAQVASSPSTSPTRDKVPVEPGQSSGRAGASSGRAGKMLPTGGRRHDRRNRPGYWT